MSLPNTIAETEPARQKRKDRSKWSLIFRASISSMYLVVSNTSTSMKDCGEVATDDGEPWYSCYGRGSYDSGQSFKVRASLR